MKNQPTPITPTATMVAAPHLIHLLTDFLSLMEWSTLSLPDAFPTIEPSRATIGVIGCQFMSKHAILAAYGGSNT